MKKLLILMSIFFFGISNIYAYNTTEKDKLILGKINKKIDLIYNKYPKKIENLYFKINKILPRLKEDSRKYVLISKIGEHIKELILKNEIKKEQDINKLKFINKNKKKEIVLDDREKEIKNKINTLLQKIKENKLSSSEIDLIFTRILLEKDLTKLINKNLNNTKIFKSLNLTKDDLIKFNIDYLNDQLKVAKLTDKTSDYEKAQEILKKIKNTFSNFNNKKTRIYLAKKSIEIGKIIGDRKAILVNTLTNTNINNRYYFEKGEYIGNITYYGNSNFIVTLKSDKFEYQDLLINEIGNLINFKFPIKIEKSGYYYFKIDYGYNPGVIKFKMNIKKVN